jgi:hypothetical protein
MSKRARRKNTISLRQRAAIALAQLYRVADVQRANGEILASGPWLKVLANVLSSMPAAYDGDRRGRSAPAFIGLSAATLMQAATRCGLAVTLDEIKIQVADTAAWRAQLSKQRGIVRFAIMRADKIGELLGVTDEIRAEARAWNIGTYGGSRPARERARKERDRMFQQAKRLAAGAKAHAHSLSRLQPWKEEGVCRRTWERRRAKAGDGGPPDGGVANSSVANSSATNRGGVANSSATNILIEPSSQEWEHAQEPSPSPASLACHKKQACQAAQLDDEWLVRRAPSGAIFVADLIPLEGFPPIGRRLPRLPDAVCRDRAPTAPADIRVGLQGLI